MTRTEILQTAKPILFNTPMVRAILEGRKTVTRRLLKQPFEVHPNGYITKPKGNERLCPYEPPYQKGDYLYVRETYGTYSQTYGTTPNPYYKADGDAPENIKWKPSIHMPKEAARIFLLVKDVRPEKLQDITEDGAKAEGICEEWARAWWKPTYYDPDSGGDAEYRETFAYDLWDSTIKPKDRGKYGWEANPWVWVIEFEKVEVEF